MRELRLHQCSAGDDGNPQLSRNFKQGVVCRSVVLGRQPDGLGHREIDRQLDDAKVVILPTRVNGSRDKLGQRQVILVCRKDTEAVPGRASIRGDLSRRDVRLELGERFTHHL